MKRVEFLGEEGLKFDSHGNKSKNLHLMKLAGLPVPAGFVIDNEALLESTQNFETISAAVRALGGYPVAVRSSSMLEDLTGASFAGLYESYLNVSSDDDLILRAKEIFRSVNGERVNQYLRSKNLPANTHQMRVLVQKMVPAKCAGVYFTLHPNEGKEEEAYTELTLGLGEDLVSGKITPSRYRISIASGEISTRDLSEQGDILSKNNALTLRDYGLKIASIFGSPQDIEFAIDENQVWILQSRPITQIRWRDDVDEFTNADFKDGGISASVCTPMMYSLYEFAMQHSMQNYFNTIRLLKKNSPQKIWIRSFYGRAYWNASEVKRQLFQIPGFREREFDLDLGIQKDYGPKGPHTVPFNLKTLISILPTAIAVAKEYRNQLKRTENYFERCFKPVLEIIDTEKKTLSLEAWVKRLIEFQGEVEIEYFRTIYNNTNLQSDFKKRMMSISNKLGIEIDFTVLYSGVEGISHLNAQRDLGWLIKVAKKQGVSSPFFKELFQVYLQEHGFHADRELDLLCPRWSEVPSTLLSRVDHFLASYETLPDALLDTRGQVAAQFQKYEKTLKSIEQRWFSNTKILKTYRWKRIRHELEQVRLYLRRREEMRECSSRAYALVRSALLQLGQKWVLESRIDEVNDIFFLDRNEISPQSFIDSTELKRRIQHRKLFGAGFTQMTPPNELGLGVHGIQSISWDATGTILKGLGCSPGQIEGTVRVITELENAYQLKKGEILVTRFTDPGWTTILSLVGGVITEVGGLLSHAAVIGRELGVPAILNLPNATSLLKSGDRILMNGNNGEIKLLSTEK